MNSEWSELNKEMQVQLKKRESFDEGRQTLFRLRKSLYEVLADMAEALTEGTGASPLRLRAIEPIR